MLKRDWKYSQISLPPTTKLLMDHFIWQQPRLRNFLLFLHPNRYSCNLSTQRWSSDLRSMMKPLVYLNNSKTTPRRSPNHLWETCELQQSSLRFQTDNRTTEVVTIGVSAARDSSAVATGVSHNTEETGSTTMTFHNAPLRTTAASFPTHAVS